MDNRLIDPFNRQVTYLRMSVTDRCDFRCVYCMAEDMEFLPRDQVLTLEEFAFIGRAFAELGVSKIRVTGGEPLVRQDVHKLFATLSALPGIKDLAVTTNGSQLTRLASELKSSGLGRINISLDSLNPDKFREITRTGDLAQVLDGIAAARALDFPVKLNAVVLKGRNDDEVTDLVEFALTHQLDISFIEEMPLGVIQEHDRALSFCSSAEIRSILSEHYNLIPATDSTGGPSRYWRVEGSDQRIGFISPHSENFCADCNRVRLTAQGRLLLCLGNEHSVDLRAVVRTYPGDMERLKAAIVDAIRIKPERHYFNLDEPPQILRFMNATGG